MEEPEATKSSASQSSRRDNEEVLKDQDSVPAAKSPKKKKVRRHRVPKSGTLGRLEEETDEENERKKLSSRERRQIGAEDIEDIPTMNYISDDKKPVEIVPDEPEEVEQNVKEVEEEEEEEEEDDEEPCMTAEEKQAMYRAAALGDIDLLEDCLDKPNSDINMVWYQENLLVAALKSEQEEMAEFLIDNGVNYNFKTTIINVKDERTRNIEWHTSSCRQLAFDRGLHDVVELIDYLNGDLFRFIKPKARIPRYRRPKPPTPEPATGGESENDASSEASKDRSDDEGDGRMKRKKKKKRKDSKEEDAEKTKEDGGEKNERREKKNKDDKNVNDNCDADSGHHSIESVADAEKEEGKKDDDVDGLGRSRSRTSSGKGRTGSSRCGTGLTPGAFSSRGQSGAAPASPPPVSRSETFMKKFMFLRCPSDEGYGSLSSKSSPTSTESKQRKPRVPITIPPRGTKSSLSMRQASLHRKALAEQEDEMPLLQKKIRIPGSYGVESSKWYGQSPRNNAKNSGNNFTNDELNMPSVDVTKNVPKRQDAHYMQMTASAYTKRKLEPNFRKAYSSLEFVSDRIFKSSQISLNRKTMHTRQTVNYSHPNIKSRKENISVNFRTFNSGRWIHPPLQSSGTPKYYRAVTRVC